MDKRIIKDNIKHCDTIKLSKETIACINKKVKIYDLSYVTPEDLKRNDKK